MVKQKRGFTLTELIIVIIIIGILIGIGSAQYINVVLRAQKTKAKHAIALIAQAEKIYASEKGNYVADLTTLSNETGIDLTQLKNDKDWGYTVDTASKTIVATKSKDPKIGGKITYYLDTGNFTESNL